MYLRAMFVGGRRRSAAVCEEASKLDRKDFKRQMNRCSSQRLNVVYSYRYNRCGHVSSGLLAAGLLGESNWTAIDLLCWAAGMWTVVG
jgi:hypothetical protein